jgi:hydroxymethylglutaryl-CoA lyase
MFPSFVTLTEVGPREGFQYEGARRAEPIPLAGKLRLINALARTGVSVVQIASFVNAKIVPQMADAELICKHVARVAGVAYTGIYLNAAGLRRARATGALQVRGELMFSASEIFTLRNQKRTSADEIVAQKGLATTYRDHGIAVDTCNIMAAFGCNFDGAIPLERVLGLIETATGIAANEGASKLRYVQLADTMGWANPEQIRRTVRAVKERWTDMSISLHLHNTRGLAVANVYAALLEGVDRFDTAIAGLGGCPFAGHVGAAGNVATEEVAFLCQELGIETGLDLVALTDSARIAEEVVGHPLPSQLVHMRGPSLTLSQRTDARSEQDDSNG